MYRCLCLIIIILPVLTACTQPVSSDNELLRFAGTYKGRLPGADSAGIDYTLTLSPDGGYKEVTLYLGKSPKPFQETGQWRIREDDIIVLNKPAPGHQMFKPDGNTLLVLDIN